MSAARSVGATSKGPGRAATKHTAIALGYWVCQSCRTLVPAATEPRVPCPRCAAPVTPRKPDSIARTWALVLAGAILYVPANVFPIMTTTRFGETQTNTIFSGIVYLFEAGTWPLGVIVFTASILVPVLKLLVLTFLLLSVQLGMRSRAHERTQLYRVTELTGRWSMIDVYVVNVLVGLVQLDEVARVEAKIGAVFFAAVVIVTMLAARSFDPRLLWDARPEATHEQR